MNNKNAQGTIEYLVVIAVVVVIGLFVVYFSLNLFDSAGVSNTSGKIGAKVGSGSISVLEAVVDDDSLLIVLSPLDPKGVELTKVIVDGVENDYNPTLFSSAKGFVLNELSQNCVCSSGQTSRTCSFQFTYITRDGLTQTTDAIDVVVECVPSVQTNNTNYTLTQDTNSPIITLLTPSNNDTITENEVTFTFQASDDRNISSCTLFIDGVDVNTITNNFSSFTKTFSGEEAWNDYEWDINCIDSSGNSSTSSNGIFDLSLRALVYAEDLSAGGEHTCVLLSSGDVDCYGDNEYARSVDYLGGDAVGLSMGYLHTCVLLSSGDVNCYGYNDYGQSEDYLGGDAVGVSAGGYHTCVLLSSGDVDCYGLNGNGQSEDYLGGDAVGVSAGTSHTCVLLSSGDVDCYGNNDVGQAVDYLGSDAVNLSAGGPHTCVLLSSGDVDCYGSNIFGQAVDYLGGGAVGVSAGGYHTCVLLSSGDVDCYGLNGNGQSEDYLGGDAVGVSAGGLHTCVLLSSGDVDCYGRNNDGQAEDWNKLNYSENQ